MKQILLLCPNSWDTTQLAAAQKRWSDGYTLLLHGEDAEDSPATFDALTFVRQAVERFGARDIHGVTSSSDYPGCLVAAAVARELGLPGPIPESVLRCSHKYYSRVAQQEVVPEATPRFALIDPDHLSVPVRHHPARKTAGHLASGHEYAVEHLAGHLDARGVTLPFPLFIKPVKSWFSQHARRINTSQELQAFAASAEVRSHLSAFVTPFNQLIGQYTDFAFDGSYLLAEELLAGEQVTVEGFVFRGQVQIVGIVDSVMYPGTISFQRFEYPSSLPPEVQVRMAGIAARVMPHLGFDNGLFNIEMFYGPETDQVFIIEINPRMCGQFADLMELVNGTNTYQILLALAAGEQPPPVHAQGRFQVAASFALRRFADQKVRCMPDHRRIDAVKMAFPVTLVKTFYREGQCLSDEDQSDGYSYRYGVINMAGNDRASLLAGFEDVQRQLGFAFENVT